MSTILDTVECSEPPTLKLSSRTKVAHHVAVAAGAWGLLLPAHPEWGLTSAATHCLMEIGDRQIGTFSALRDVLEFGEPELHRVIQELRSAGYLEPPPPPAAAPPSEADGRDTVAEEAYVLTVKGKEALDVVNNIAVNQVQGALTEAQHHDPAAVATIMNGLQLYATAIQGLRTQRQQLKQGQAKETAVPVDAASVAVNASTPRRTANAQREVRIVAGYRPGILARSVEMHMRFYSRNYGWGYVFESAFSNALAEFLSRVERPANEIWAAVQMVKPCGAGEQKGPDEEDEQIVGTIIMDGEDLGRPGVAHLRAFIVDESVRGSGTGRRLMSAAMSWVRRKGFKEVHLNTMRSLVAARRIYESFGFVELGEVETDEYGQPITVLQYSWKLQ